MVTTKAKGPDKQDICKKLTVALKKKYPAPAKYPSLPVMETMLYAICLDNNTPQEAQDLYDRVLKGFHDLNEMRVSSTEELEDLISPTPFSELRAIRMRDVLHHVFENEYKFDYEGLKRKTLEQAIKILNRVRSLSWFVRAYVLHHNLGAHVLPIDDQMHAILCWLGIGAPEAGPEQTAEGLRGFIRKTEGSEFCHYLRLCSSDPAYKSIIQNYAKIHEAGNWSDVAPLERLSNMLKGQLARKKPPAPKAVPTPPSPAKPKAKGATKVPMKVSAKPATKKTAPKKSEKKEGAKPAAQKKSSPPPSSKKPSASSALKKGAKSKPSASSAKKKKSK